MAGYLNLKNYSMVLGNLRLPDLPKELELAGDRFIVKKEFHVTLISLEHNAEIIDPGNVEQIKAGLIKDFYDYTGRQPLTEYQLTDDLRLVDDGGNKTVVIMVTMPKIEDFFIRLSQKYGADLSVQPTHITLYTLPTDTFGIPICSYQELEAISEPIELARILECLQPKLG